MLTPDPIHELPSGYREAEHLVVTESGKLFWLNVLSLIPIAAAVVVMGLWGSLVLRLRGSWLVSPGGQFPSWLALLLVLLVTLPLHEAVHGLAIIWVGHRPRFGMKLSKMVIYATTEDGLFRRDEFIFVALAPLVLITLVGMLLAFAVPDWIGYYTSLAVVLNAGGAIGDLWMVAVVLRYPPSAIVRDEADGIRIFTPAVN